MILEEKMEGLMVFCDHKGIIEEVLYNNSLPEAFIKKGVSFFDILDEHNLGKGKSFFEKIRKENVVFNWELNVKYENRIDVYYFAGLKIKEKILIISTDSFSKLNKIYEEILRINVEQVNTIRGLMKEKVMDIDIHENENDFYNQISKLNNELSNMQRELTKKNIEQKRLNEKLKEMALFDFLTGLYNRRHFYEKFTEEITKAERLRYDISLAYMDINNFKEINDKYGHEAGDKLLVDFAKIARDNLRKNFDYIFRFGGDEFLIMFLNCEKNRAQEIVERIDAALVMYNNKVSLSYGITGIDLCSDQDIEVYIKEIDKKMYIHKNILKKKMKSSLK